MEQTIGKINLTTGNLTITDPCYKKGTWCTAELKNVRKGEWTGFAEVKNCGMWGKRVSRLTLEAAGELVDTFATLEADIGVDSGTCGIFENKPDYEDDWSSVCDEMRNPDGKGILRFGLARKDSNFRCEGVWSCSGYGDGGYEATVGYNKDKEIVFITIDYNVDGEYDEDYDDDDEDYD